MRLVGISISVCAAVSLPIHWFSVSLGADFIQPAARDKPTPRLDESRPSDNADSLVPASRRADPHAAPNDSNDRRLAEAMASGLEMLTRDVLATPFGTELTVRQACQKLKIEKELGQAVRDGARQWGGPRWREDGLCEVRLQLDGTAVAPVLLPAERGSFAQLGMTSDGFRRALAALRLQQFSAIGVNDPEPTERSARVSPTVGAGQSAGSQAGATQPARPGSGVAATLIPSQTGGSVDASIPTNTPQQPANHPSLIPRDAPAWVTRQMDADGRGGGTGLKGARAAEAVAMAQLRRQVDQLELREGLTLADAARQNPAIGRAVTDALSRARLLRVIYNPDTVDARLSVDLDWIWRRLVGLDRDE